MKINDEGTSNAAHWHERAMKAESRLAEAEALLREASSAIDDRLSYMSGDPLAELAARIDAHLSRKEK